MERVAKLKDNVKFEELEKYGFYQSNKFMNCWQFDLFGDPNENYCEDPIGAISVQEYVLPDGPLSDRVFDITLIQDDELHYYFPAVMFDLFIDGLIEIVEIEIPKLENEKEN